MLEAMLKSTMTGCGGVVKTRGIMLKSNNNIVDNRGESGSEGFGGQCIEGQGVLLFGDVGLLRLILGLTRLRRRVFDDIH